MKVLREIPRWMKVTVRQVYYQLVAKRVIPNIVQAYARYDRILVDLRRRHPNVDTRIVDRTRPLYRGETSSGRSKNSMLKFGWRRMPSAPS